MPLPDSGLLTKKQLKVLELRSKGLTQREAAKELNTTRANISMIEWRARRRLAQARHTLRAYDTMQEDLRVEIREGTKLVDIPTKVLKVCDRRHVHLTATVVDVIKVIKSTKPYCITDGKVSQKFSLRIDRSGAIRAE